MMTYSISESTKNILKNFANINDNIVLSSGQRQRTCNGTKSILAVAQFDTAWPKDTPIYNLPEFLSNVNTYDKPSLEFEEKQFVIRGANSPSHVEYPYSDPSVVMAPPDKVLPVDNPRAIFALSETTVKEIKKFIAINALPTILVSADGANQTIIIKPYDDKNPSSRTYSYPVHSDAKNITTLDADASTQFKFKSEHFNLLMDGGYTVHLGDWPYMFFEHQTEPVSYYIVKKS